MIFKTGPARTQAIVTVQETTRGVEICVDDVSIGCLINGTEHHNPRIVLYEERGGYIFSDVEIRGPGGRLLRVASWPGGTRKRDEP